MTCALSEVNVTECLIWPCRYCVTYAYVYIHMYVYVCIHMYIGIHTYVYIRTYTYICVHTCTYICTHVRMYAYMRVHMYLLCIHRFGVLLRWREVFVASPLATLCFSLALSSSSFCSSTACFVLVCALCFVYRRTIRSLCTATETTIWPSLNVRRTRNRGALPCAFRGIRGSPRSLRS